MMKRLFFAFGMLVTLTISTPAAAWMYWYQAPIAYTPFEMYYFHGTPYTVPSALPIAPGFHMWSAPAFSSGIYVQQTQTPTGYYYRINVQDRRLEDINLSVQDGTLIIRSAGSSAIDRHAGGGAFFFQQSGGYFQMLSVPADANVGAMNIARSPGLIEVFIPRFR